MGADEGGRELGTSGISAGRCGRASWYNQAAVHIALMPAVKQVTEAQP